MKKERVTKKRNYKRKVRVSPVEFVEAPSKPTLEMEQNFSYDKNMSLEKAQQMRNTFAEAFASVNNDFEHMFSSPISDESVEFVKDNFSSSDLIKLKDLNKGKTICLRDFAFVKTHANTIAKADDYIFTLEKTLIKVLKERDALEEILRTPPKTYLQKQADKIKSLWDRLFGKQVTSLTLLGGY